MTKPWHSERRPAGKLPTSGDYAYELKWDGFRAIVSPFATTLLQPARA
jgi:ATP-dependent DNA ligase